MNCKIGEAKSNHKKIGDYIQLVVGQNNDLGDLPLVGLSIQKKHIPSIAYTIETDMSNSRIIEKINLRMVIRKDLKSQSIIKKY